MWAVDVFLLLGGHQIVLDRPDLPWRSSHDPFACEISSFFAFVSCLVVEQEHGGQSIRRLSCIAALVIKENLLPSNVG